MPYITSLIHKSKFKIKDRYEQFLDKKVADAVWGASYSVFDGEELLESSLLSIRDETGYINVVYQRTSWYGNPCSDRLIDILNDCKNKNLIDELIEYIPDLSKSARTQQREKRNIGLRHAIRAGCSFFMTMDCDEFYVKEELAKAKRYIIEHRITNSYVLQAKYSYSPCCRELDYVGYVGFFSAVNKRTVLGRPDKRSPCLIDSTRRVSPPAGRKRYYVLPSIKMHHMEFVRKNLKMKTENSAWNDKGERWSLPPKVLERNEKVIKGDYVIVDNRFKIQI